MALRLEDVSGFPAMRVVGPKVCVVRDDVRTKESNVKTLMGDAVFHSESPKDPLKSKPSGTLFFEGVGSAGAGIKSAAGLFRDNHRGLDLGQVLLVIKDFAGFPHHKWCKLMLGLAWLFE